MAAKYLEMARSEVMRTMVARSSADLNVGGTPIDWLIQVDV
jgi:hypothetical protein